MQNEATNPFVNGLVALSCAADDPASMARAIGQLAAIANWPNLDAIAVAGMLGFIVGRSGPKDHPTRKAAAMAIEVFRTCLPHATAIDLFEQMIEMGATPPDTDGDGLDAEAVSSNVVQLLRRAA
ncbi:MAG: hypothetical protein ABIW82_11080 [Dokdonella sp.]